MQIAVGQSGESLSAQELITGRTCVIAQSGAGKSWTIAVLCEQLCEAGLGFCIIDTEGEYFSLKEKYDILWVGLDERADLDISAVNLEELAKKVLRSRTPLILDVSEVDARATVELFLRALYTNSKSLRSPYLIIIEEADKFIPQSKESLKIIEEIARRGRKRGLGLLIASQRPSLVNKNVLSQCSGQIIGKLTIENDLRAVSQFFSSRSELEQLVNLRPGEFFLMGNLVQNKIKIKVRQRQTKHISLTPELRARAKESVQKLRELLQKEVVIKKFAGKAIKPKIDKEQISKLAFKKKKLLCREVISNVKLKYWPLLLVKVKYVTRFLRTVKRASFILDGVNGKLLSLKRGKLNLEHDLHGLVGLSENELRVIFALKRGEHSREELELETNLSTAAVVNAIEKLRERILITENKVGRKKVYTSLLPNVKLPNLFKMREDIPFELTNPVNKIDRKIFEQDIRALLKVMNPACEIENFEVFYYPVWYVTYKSKKAQRTLKFDGLSGKVINFL